MVPPVDSRSAWPRRRATAPRPRADGVSRTFRVTADTLVNAARDGIGTVKVNDSVAVVAVKSGDSATAVRIVDASRADTSRERFGFRER